MRWTIGFMMAMMAANAASVIWAEQAMADWFVGGYILQSLCGDKQSASTCDGYISGILDSLDPVARTFVEQLPKVCAPRDLTQARVHGIVVSWLKAHPGSLGFNGSTLVAQSLAEAFPCPLVR